MKNLSDNYSFILIMTLLTIAMFMPAFQANAEMLQQQRLPEKVLEFVMMLNR